MNKIHSFIYENGIENDRAIEGLVMLHYVFQDSKTSSSQIAKRKVYVEVLELKET